MPIAMRIYLRLAFYFLLLGYFTLGKGFAYLHIPGTPIYIGEIFLALGLVIFLYTFKGSLVHYFIPILLFCIWGMLITVRDFPDYGIETLRDSAMYYYALFSLILFTILYKRQNIECLWRYLLFAFKLMLILHVIFKIGALFDITLDLEVPDTDGIRLYWMKLGDLGALLAGATVLFLMEYKNNNHIKYYIYIVLSVIMAVIVFAFNRGGFLAFLGGVGIYFLFQPLPWKIKYTFIIFIILIASFLLLPSKSLDNETGRTLSKDQIVENVMTIVDPMGSRLGSGTTRWRLMFWSELIDETANVSLISGQGLGPNLAGIFGYSPENEIRPNKHPHNYTVNVFARLGIFGLIFWIAINVSYFIRLKQAIQKSDGVLKDLLLFCLVIWFAMLINSSFDVYLEGPMGAIPFWAFMGVGLSLTTFVATPACEEMVEYAA